MKIKKEANKKALSPIIATVLLIVLVVVIAAIILAFSRAWIKEVIEKQIGNQDPQNVENFCKDISLRSIINDESFGFTNIGNVPISDFKLKTSGGGASRSDPTGQSVPPGASYTTDGNYYEHEEVKIIPTILGKTKTGEIVPFECPERNAILI